MWWLLLGCAANLADSASADPEVPQLSDSMPYLPTASPPSWTAAEVEALLTTALSQGFPDPLVINAHFSEAMAGADERCPPRLPGGGFSMPQSSCTSANGYYYYGVAEYLVGDDRIDASEDWKMGICSFNIGFPNGDIFACGGAFSYSRTATDAGFTFTAVDDAAVSWPGGPAWSGAESASALAITGKLDGEHLTYELSGGLLGAETALYFDRLAWDNESCEGAPALSLRLRDPNGYWYTVTTGAACDPCGPVVYDGAELGTVCLDATEAARSLGESVAPPQ